MFTIRKDRTPVEPLSGLKLLINSEDIISHKKGIAFLFESNLYLPTEQGSEFYKKNFVVISRERVAHFINALNEFSPKKFQEAIRLLAERNSLSPQELYERLLRNNETLLRNSETLFNGFKYTLNILEDLQEQQSASIVDEGIFEPFFERILIENVHLATSLSMTCKTLYKVYLQTIYSFNMKREEHLYFLYQNKEYSITPKAQKQADLIDYLETPTIDSDGTFSHFKNYLPIIDYSHEDSQNPLSWYFLKEMRYLKIANMILSPDSFDLMPKLTNLQTCILENLHLSTISFLDGLSIKRLSLKGSYIEEDRITVTLDEYKHALKINGSQKSFQNFPTNHLEVLDLSECDSVHRDVMLAISKIQSLKVIFLNKQNFALNYLYRLTALDLSHISLEKYDNSGLLLKSLKDIGKHLKVKHYFKSTSLSLNSCSFTEKEILKLLTYFPNLEALSVQSTKITKIRPIIERCPRLQKIDLSFCKVPKKKLQHFLNSELQITIASPVSTTELEASTTELENQFARLSL